MSSAIIEIPNEVSILEEHSTSIKNRTKVANLLIDRDKNDLFKTITHDLIDDVQSMLTRYSAK
jgi:hypothetical protein